MSGYTPGPWTYENNWPEVRIISANGAHIVADYDTSFIEYPDDEANEANARLIAAAPDLLEALKQAISLAWEDSREVVFDSTVMFGIGYDFDGWDLFRSEIHTPAGSWAVWRSGGKYSVYGGPDGGMWFEKFDSREDAEEVALREIDRLCPSFPTAIARAAISRATGEGE